MVSQQTAGSRRPHPKRTLWIVLASALILLLAAAGIWWGVKADSSDTPAESSATGATAAVLPDRTQLGTIELRTAALAPMRDFYVDAVGLEVLGESSEHLSLGNNGVELLSVTRTDGLSADSPTEAGLYHSAILYRTAQALAQTLLNVVTEAPQSYAGSADHAVSLAFYFSDPDGNGLELYSDTPREEWVWKDGLVQMGSAVLDPNAFLNEHLGAAATDAAATVGHVHLRVGDLKQARAFYADTLGFAVTAEANGALFYAAGGYHHHLATNTWNSAGAKARGESSGLGSLAVHVGDEAALQDVARRLSDAGLTFMQESGLITVDDPWGNTVRLLA